jgi:Kef-type K+ transport system membrane component KefB
VLSTHARTSFLDHARRDASVRANKQIDTTAENLAAPLDIRKTRLGTILMTAAVADDVITLVLATIVPSLGIGEFTWCTVARPVFVSLACVMLVPAATVFAINPCIRWARRRPWGWLHTSTVCQALKRSLGGRSLYSFALVVIASGFVAATHYAGTSELLGAYVAGCWLRSIGHALCDPPSQTTLDDRPETEVPPTDDTSEPFSAVFESMMAPIQNRVLAPLFFGSIGCSIPFLGLWRPARVVWQGFLYAFLMAVGKMLAGVWWIVWKSAFAVVPCASPSDALCVEQDVESPALFNKARGALFLGTALVARGEIALLVASLARQLLQQSPSGQEQEELYSIVMWATLACTVCGTMGVGVILRMWK